MGAIDYCFAAVAYFFAIGIPAVIILPPLYGRLNHLKDDFIGFDK